MVSGPVEVYSSLDSYAFALFLEQVIENSNPAYMKLLSTKQLKEFNAQLTKNAQIAVLRIAWKKSARKAYYEYTNPAALQRRGKYKRYSDEERMQIVAYAKNEGLTQASLKFGIRENKIEHWCYLMDNPDSENSRKKVVLPNRVPVVPCEIEKLIADEIRSHKTILTRSGMKTIAVKHCVGKIRNFKASQGWLDGFMKRHGFVHLKDKRGLKKGDNRAIMAKLQKRAQLKKEDEEWIFPEVRDITEKKIKVEESVCESLIDMDDKVQSDPEPEKQSELQSKLANVINAKKEDGKEKEDEDWNFANEKPPMIKDFIFSEETDHANCDYKLLRKELDNHFGNALFSILQQRNDAIRELISREKESEINWRNHYMKIEVKSESNSDSIE